MISKPIYSKIVSGKTKPPLLLLLMIGWASMAWAQPLRVSARLDTNAILIGQQAHLTLTAEYATGSGEIHLSFPTINDTLVKQLEVVQKSKIEKFIPDSNDLSRFAQQQTITLTSFDSGYYAIPPFKFYLNNDTTKAYETEALLFAVNTVNIDTTRSIMDIKPPIEVPFSWQEYLPYVYQALALIAIVAAIVFLIIQYIKKKKKKTLPIIETPKIPIHVTALEKLEKLKNEKRWQQGKLKEYHSELSDIIRDYIEKRFYINAMEQVTDETIHALRKTAIDEEQKIKLRNILFLSDLVKFAKEQPLPNENELSITHAIEFIEATKQEAPTKTNLEQPIK